MTNKIELAQAVTEAKEAFMYAGKALHDAVQALVDHETAVPVSPPADPNASSTPAPVTPAAVEVPASAETTPATETAGEQNG